MEILPSVRTQCSRTPPFPNPLCFVNTSRNSIFFNGEANPISLNTSCFHQSKGRKLVLSSSHDEGAAAVAHQGLDNSPLSMELVPISGESQFDRVLADAQQLDECVVVLWMASWCRKCIYLKPKLQKLAADYYPSVKFYSVDVNNVPHKLVVRAEVTKMPTIQLWRDGEKKGEVIGGHKAYLVVNEVREIIENETSL